MRRPQLRLRHRHKPQRPQVPAQAADRHRPWRRDRPRHRDRHRNTHRIPWVATSTRCHRLRGQCPHNRLFSSRDPARAQEREEAKAEARAKAPRIGTDRKGHTPHRDGARTNGRHSAGKTRNRGGIRALGTPVVGRKTSSRRHDMAKRGVAELAQIQEPNSEFKYRDGGKGQGRGLVCVACAVVCATCIAPRPAPPRAAPLCRNTVTLVAASTTQATSSTQT